MAEAAGGFVTVLVDFSNRRNPPADAQAAAQRYGIRSIPVSILLTPDGDEIDRFVGGMNADDLVARLNDLAREHAREPIIQPSLDAAVEAAQGEHRQGVQIAVLAGPDSDFGRELEDTLLAEDLRGAISHYVWVREIRRDGGFEVIVHEADDDRTVVSRRELLRRGNEPALTVMRQALSGPDR